jgi:hypothetical protein
MLRRPPREAGIEQANWHWKAVRCSVGKRVGITLRRGSCLTYLHRLGVVRKRPTKLLLMADEVKRAAFVAAYVTLRRDTRAREAKVLFADKTHCPTASAVRHSVAR